MTTIDRPEPPDETPPGAATKPRSRLPLIGATVAVLALSALGLSQCGWVQKAKLDREVDRLCAIDGGVRIYETVTLPKENFGPDGEVFPQFRGLPGADGRYGPDFYSTVRETTLVAGNPKLRKWQVGFYRRLDGKLLAEKVSYERGGGDSPGVSNPTSHICPAMPIKDQDVFTKKESKK